MGHLKKVVKHLIAKHKKRTALKKIAKVLKKRFGKKKMMMVGKFGGFKALVRHLKFAGKFGGKFRGKKGGKKAGKKAGRKHGFFHRLKKHLKQMSCPMGKPNCVCPGTKKQCPKS